MEYLCEAVKFSLVFRNTTNSNGFLYVYYEALNIMTALRNKVKGDL